VNVRFPVFGEAESEPVNLAEATIDWFTYKPTKITFNYQYTHNHSISEVATIGQSLYKYSGGPTFFEFIAQDVDDYTFTLTIGYTNATQNLTVLVGLFSGNLPPQGFSIKGKLADTIIINVHLKVTEQPSYPTDDQVADAVVNKIQQNLVQQQEENRKLWEQVKTATMTSNIYGVIASVCSVVALLLAAYTFARRRVREVA
jgi:hypothetical protein